MSNFARLHDVIRHLHTDPSTAQDPIKRMFLFDGHHLTANLTILEDTGNLLHTQNSHDELVYILGGECEFRCGDETSRVGEGDLIFIPRGTIHGPLMRPGERLAALSIFGPHFDRGKKNIEWDRDK